MKNWYIVQSHSSFENKVAQLIKEEAEKAKISEKFEEIVVPTHDITEVKRGKRVQRKKKYFPGYVLIKSEMDNNIYHMIKGINKMINPLRFIQEVKQEAFKVTWPTKKDVLIGSAMVFVLATIAALFFLLLDQIYKFLLDIILTINF